MPRPWPPIRRLTLRSRASATWWTTTCRCCSAPVSRSNPFPEGHTMTATPLPQRPAWKALQGHFEQVKSRHLRELFAEDPKRGERLTAEAVGVFLDYSKNRVTDETLKLLLGLAQSCGVRERIDAMFRGDKINVTERRAVLHVALRAPRGATIVVDGV